MNCLVTPTVTCGTTTPDACINITGSWPACFPTDLGPCYRQADFNTVAGSVICNIINTIGGANGTPLNIAPLGISSIINSIDLRTLTIGNCVLGLTNPPVHTSVAAELQNIYNILCTYLPISLTTPLTLSPLPNGISLGCLQAPCGVPIGTLGGLLQALVNAVCEEPYLIYKATLSQSGTAANSVVTTTLEDTLDPGFAMGWLRTGVGVYTFTAGTGTPFSTPGKVVITVGSSIAIGSQVVASRSASNQITVYTATAGTLADGVLSNTYLEIKVYP